MSSTMPRSSFPISTASSGYRNRTFLADCSSKRVSIGRHGCGARRTKPNLGPRTISIAATSFNPGSQQPSALPATASGRNHCMQGWFGTRRRQMETASDQERRDTWTAVKRGLRSRCPHCGEGRLFRAFLKPVDRCRVCGEYYSHQRADDLPAYLSIVIVGHIAVGGFMLTDQSVSWSNWVHLAIWAPLTVALALLTIQPIKGGVIGWQWATRMHGFGT